MAQNQSGYASFVRTLARDFSSFRALQAFLELKDSPSCKSLRSTITYIDFQADDELISRTIHETELKTVATPGVKRLFIIDNLSAETTITLGDAFNIDPQFFLDFIDAIPAEWDVTETPKRSRDTIIPKPWYNFEKAIGHLPMLNSMRENNHHIAIRYIGSREYQNTTNRQKLNERVEPDLSKMVVERIAGLHRPVSRAGKDFDIVAMIRHTAAVWFAPRPNKEADWTTGERHLRLLANCEHQIRFRTYVCSKALSSWIPHLKPKIQPTARGCNLYTGPSCHHPCRPLHRQPQ